MIKKYDTIVVGAGIIGMATAYYLSQTGEKIAVIEKKYIGSGSTGRCIGGIRQQFSTSASIGLMKESMDLFDQMEQEFGHDVEFHRGGYLFLAHTSDMMKVFKKNVELQQKEGVDVSVVSPDQIKEIVPHINTDGILGGTYCPDDGQAFPFAVLRGYWKKSRENGTSYYLGKAMTGITREQNFTLTLEDGTRIESEKVVLCTGPQTREIGLSLGLDLPMYPERHEALITERLPRFFEPMIVDYRSDGCYFQQLVSGQIIGCYTPVPNVPGIREDVSFEFLPSFAWRMCRLVPSLKYASMLRHWAGCYNMTPDGNPIVDKSDIENLYIASGMSGHGFMFGPAIGKHLAHFINHDEWLSDFSEFAVNRNFQSAETMK